MIVVFPIIRKRIKCNIKKHHITSLIKNSSNSRNITHKKVFLLAVNISCADGIVGFVFLFNCFLALREEETNVWTVKAEYDMNSISCKNEILIIAVPLRAMARDTVKPTFGRLWNILWIIWGQTMHQNASFPFTMRLLPRKAWRKPLLPLPMSPKTLQRKTLRWVCFFCRSIFLALVTAGGKPHTGIRGSVKTAAVHNTWSAVSQLHRLNCCIIAVMTALIHWCDYRWLDCDNKLHILNNTQGFTNRMYECIWKHLPWPTLI